MALLSSSILALATPTFAASYRWTFPEGFPKPATLADNPMTVEKVLLGRYLFYDRCMSGYGTQAQALRVLGG
jgi:cytochrome c peroxidase